MKKPLRNLILIMSLSLMVGMECHILIKAFQAKNLISLEHTYKAKPVQLMTPRWKKKKTLKNK